MLSEPFLLFGCISGLSNPANAPMGVVGFFLAALGLAFVLGGILLLRKGLGTVAAAKEANSQEDTDG